MDSGFRQEHFDYLDAFAGEVRDKSNARQNEAHASLVDAYEATARWANAIKDRLFPRGYVRKRSDPVNQAQKFKPYTWVRIYPRPDAPLNLAYTLGIDAAGVFCVKIDVVKATPAVQERYDALSGGDHFRSPFAAILMSAPGLTMSFEALVDWSVEQIESFEPSYDELARRLDLISPTLRLVTDPTRTHEAFARWVDALRTDATSRGSLFAMGDGTTYFMMQPEAERIDCKLGVDPLGREWAVEINEPTVPGDHARLSAIAEDDTGGLALLRQGWLHGRRTEGDIRGELFEARTGLRPATIAAEGKAAARRWFIVTHLDDPPGVIQRDTASFVARCAAARAALSLAEPAPAATNGEIVDGGTEGSGVYWVGPQAALDARTVRRLHGGVWNALASRLSAAGIPFSKWREGAGFEIDMVIDPPSGPSLLIEIKTSASAGDIHTGVGQLKLYPQLMPSLLSRQPVLLLNHPPPRAKQAIEALGIAVHCYTRPSFTSDEGITFSPEFLALCGLAAGP